MTNLHASASSMKTRIDIDSSMDVKGFFNDPERTLSQMSSNAICDVLTV